ncbi:peptide ABC transporter substrate-binding protein [Ensifer sp. ENS05]|uniref:ABC transporter substrate-binding protein n=1 Tax=Ensifer sp. ENS05 TaxID=2769277 RepID=UPI00177DD664|nr:ABC transporter substrate-binding protein [Ensifer sp. ENS05]MBD9597325.1 peptide ABC transporter substrate-binding protein [Ensifer sp. ENS05]
MSVSRILLSVIGLIVLPTLVSAQDKKAVTIVLPEAPAYVDACQVMNSSTGRVVKLNVLEALTQVDLEKGGAKPRLATHWERVSDNTWRFHLRQGVSFHDGTPMTPEAVVYSIERTLDPKMSCDVRQRYFSNSKVTARAVDGETVDITTEPAQPILPTLMEAIPIVSTKTPRDAVTRMPVGTGPYIFSNWDTQRQIVLDRSARYWGQLPEVTQARYLWRQESFVRASMVGLGEADIGLLIADQHADNPKTDFVFNNAEMTRIHIHIDQPPLNDLRVRKALNLALDRESLVGVLFNKEARPASQIVGPSVLGYNPEVKPYRFDAQEARRLVEEARSDGVPVDRQIVMHARANNFPNDNEVMEAFVAMWAAVGLNVKVEVLELAQFRAALRPPFSPDRLPTLSITSHDNTTGDAAFSIVSKYHSSSWQTDIPSPEMDRQIEDATASTGEGRRRKFQAIFDRVHEDIVPEVWMYDMVSTVRISPRIHYVPNAATNAQVDLSDISFN